MEDLIFGLQILSWTFWAGAIVAVPLWGAIVVLSISGDLEGKHHLIFVTPLFVAKFIGISYVLAGIPAVLP